MKNRAVLLLVIAFIAPSCAPPAEEVELLVEGVTVHRGDGGDPLVADVAVRDGRFFALEGSGERRFEAVRTYAGEGRYLVPGLWDAHAHLRAAEEGGMEPTQFLRHGVTSVRDLGSYGERIRTLRRRIETGEVAGPSVYAAFETLNGEAFAGFQRAVTTEEEVVVAVQEHAQAGADQIKVHRALSPELLPVVIREARARELPVTGHIPLGMHPLDACEAGMDGIEHVGSFLEAWISVSPEAAEAGSGEETMQAALDYGLSDEAGPLIDCLVERGVEVAPTLVVYPEVAANRSEGGEIPQSFLDFIDGLQQVVLRIHRAGVTLLAGTDTSDLDVMDIPPGVTLLDELEMLQDSGIAPSAILPMATANVARAIGVENRTGTIALGRDADFLLLSGDPSEDVRHLRDPVVVVQKGEVVWPREASAGE